MNRPNMSFGGDEVQLDRVYTWAMMQQQIEQATDMAMLRAVHEQMRTTAHRWRERGMPELEILQAINRWHDLLMRRVVELEVSALERDGEGRPPSPFCWLLLGSGGRQEQTLHLDQDNALIYEAVSVEMQAAAETYFQKLATRVVEHLAAIGYPYCRGYVMATNGRWNASWPVWQERMRGYAAMPNWEHARFLMMAADVRPVYGEFSLAEGLAVWLRELLKEQAFLHWQVADHEAAREVGLDVWGRIRVERWGEQVGQLNIKERGYLQVVNAVRLWALAAGVAGSSTLERIKGLEQAAVWDDVFANEVSSACELFLRHRLWSNYVCPERLPDGERKALKAALHTVKRLQKRTFQQFRKPKR